MINLLPHQEEALELTKDYNKVAYYYDMGLGKTFMGSEKAMDLHSNILVVCQKSKVNDWFNHFVEYYNYRDTGMVARDLTDKEELEWFFKNIHNKVRVVGIINYDLIWRRPELSKLSNFTLMLDESSLIQNDTSKRSKFILKKLNPTNVILLSGTPTGGKYELLWSQMHLLGWNISKDLYYKTYVDVDTSNGYPVIVGYKNEERLKRKMRAYGCVFKKTEEVIDLPEQRFINVKIDEIKEYKKFMKDGIVTINDKELIGDTTLTKLLYARMLCGGYNQAKLDALSDLIDSTDDRLVIFYNFKDELEAIKTVIQDRPISEVNGSVKDLENYENCSNSITLVQYQAGAMGINLQKSNKIIYFSPTLSSELYEQSKKRIHRIGQVNKCLYYKLVSGIEWSIYNTLDTRKDYTDKLFEEELENDKLS